MAKKVWLGQPAPPAEKTCDWCGKPGAEAIEIYKVGKKIGTAQFLYPCARHIDVAKRSVEQLRTRKAAA